MTPHNVNAILRSCDAVGVMKVHLLYYIEEFPTLSRVASSGAHKWIEYERHTSVEECFSKLRAEQFRILATKIDPCGEYALFTRSHAANGYRTWQRTPWDFGEEAAKLADDLIYIPMMGWPRV